MRIYFVHCSSILFPFAIIFTTINFTWYSFFNFSFVSFLTSLILLLTTKVSSDVVGYIQMLIMIIIIVLYLVSRQLIGNRISFPKGHANALASNFFYCVRSKGGIKSGGEGKEGGGKQTHAQRTSEDVNVDVTFINIHNLPNDRCSLVAPFFPHTRKIPI